MKIHFEGGSLEEFEALVEIFSEGSYITWDDGEDLPVQCFEVLDQLRKSGGDTEDLDEALRARFREEMIAAINFMEGVNVKIKEKEFYLSCF